MTIPWQEGIHFVVENTNVHTTPFLDKKAGNAIEENLETLSFLMWDRVCSQIFKCSSSKLGLHHDLTLNKFECTPFKTTINLSRGSIYFKTIDQGVE
jgi:hypothetical protein